MYPQLIFLARYFRRNIKLQLSQSQKVMIEMNSFRKGRVFEVNIQTRVYIIKLMRNNQRKQWTLELTIFPARKNEEGMNYRNQELL